MSILELNKFHNNIPFALGVGLTIIDDPKAECKQGSE